MIWLIDAGGDSVIAARATQSSPAFLSVTRFAVANHRLMTKLARTQCQSSFSVLVHSVVLVATRAIKVRAFPAAAPYEQFRLFRSQQLAKTREQPQKGPPTSTNSSTSL